MPNSTGFSICDDRILVKETKPESSGGIVLPETRETDYLFGEIIDRGNERILESGAVKTYCFTEGDIVVFFKGSARKVELDKQEYYILRMDDVVLVKNKEENAAPQTSDVKPQE